MEPSNQYGTVVQKPKWQLRWGHILLALFFVVLIVIAYIVVHQINSADKIPLANNTSNNHATTNNNKNKSNSSNKSTASSSSSNSKTQSTNGSTTPSSSTATNGGTTSTNNSTSLANTGPGDTIGIFVAVTVLGTFGHYLYTKRRLRLSE